MSELNPWGVYKFAWGTAVKHRASDKWERIIFSDGQELDVSKWEVELSDRGIEIKDSNKKRIV